MASKPKAAPKATVPSVPSLTERRSRGRTRAEGATFPVAPPRAELPDGYQATLADLKQRIQEQRLRVVLTANTAMILLYWDIGRVILARQEQQGWGAKVIDRLAADLQASHPEMSGLSPRNLKYMRAFAAAWPDEAFVQRVVAQIPWRQNLALLEGLKDPATRGWYAEQTIAHGWSQAILKLQIERRAHERAGKAITNFDKALPPSESDLAAQIFKDPYLFDFLGTADPRREAELEQGLVDLPKSSLLSRRASLVAA